MKHILLKTMIVIVVLAFSVNSNSYNDPFGVGCASEGLTYVCGEDEVDQIGDDAALNCCAGSSIEYYDVCRNIVGVVLILVDGSNSSCAEVE